MQLNKVLRQLTAFLGVPLMVFFLATSPAAKAQSLTTGAITGSVLDPTRAAVANATITVTDIETSASRTVKTGPNGNYSVPSLVPGQYKLSVSAPGFKTQEQGPVSVVVSQSLNLDFKLELGTTTQVVEVTSAPPLVQTATPNTTTTVTSQLIDTLPNPGMDLSYVAQIAPGAI